MCCDPSPLYDFYSVFSFWGHNAFLFSHNRYKLAYSSNYSSILDPLIENNYQLFMVERLILAGATTVVKTFKEDETDLSLTDDPKKNTKKWQIPVYTLDWVGTWLSPTTSCSSSIQVRSTCLAPEKEAMRGMEKVFEAYKNFNSKLYCKLLKTCI